MTQKTAAIFVDMLGFASLVEREGEAIESFNAFRPDYEMFTTLEERYLAFQELLETALHRKLQNRNLQAILFSDSAFIVFEEEQHNTGATPIGHAMHFARGLMRSMLACGVPVRMGIGVGTYRALRFRSDSDPGGMISIHTALFLGSAIVRAHRAESCGLPGTRIFLHPEIDPENDVSLWDRERLLAIPPEEAAGLRTAVCHELIFLHRDGDAGTMANEVPVKPPISNREIVIHLGALRLAAPEAELRHYKATERSIERGRVQLGIPPFAD